MKKHLLITVMTIVSALPIAAQGRPSGRTSNRLDFLTGYLNFSDAQKQQAETIFDSANQASETTRGQLTAARSTLTEAVKANRSETELDRLGAAVGVIEGQLAAINAKASAKFYALLTAEQKQKYDELGSRGPGGPGRAAFGHGRQ